MANKLYGSTGGLSNEVTKMYVSVGGLSDNVVKGYCSVGGLSKLFFGSGGGGDTPKGFWFNYATSAGVDIQGKRNQSTININKMYEGMVFFFIIEGLDLDGYYDIIVLSPVNQTSGGQSNLGGYHEAVYDGSTHYINPSWTYNMYDDRWMYGIGTNVFRFNGIPSYPADYSPDCFLSYSSFIQPSTTIHDIVRDYILPNFIYTDDFAEDYQVGQRYNLVKADMEKTIRNFLGVYIYKMVSYKDSYSTAYSSILANVENIVTYLLQHSGNNDIIDLWADYNDSGGFRLGAYYSNESTDNIRIENIDSDEGGYTAIETDAYIHYSSCAYIDFNGDGTVTYNTPSWTADDSLYIGKGGYGWDYLHWSNVGLNFTSNGGYKNATHSPDEYISSNHYSQPVSLTTNLHFDSSIWISNGSTITNYYATNAGSINSSEGIVYGALLYNPASIYDPNELEYMIAYVSTKPFTYSYSSYNSQTGKTTNFNGNGRQITKTGNSEIYYIFTISLGYTVGGSSYHNRYKSSNFNISKFSKVEQVTPQSNNDACWELGHIIFTGNIS